MATRTSVRAELTGTVTDGARRISEHPYYRGLRDGTLPGAALVHFTLQDSCHLLPSYGRAHARCAALARDSRRAALLSRMAAGSLEDCTARLTSFGETAERLGLPYAADAGPPPAAPATLSYASFLGDSCAASLAAGIGALIPSAWLYLLVTDELLDHHDPASRYAPEVRKAHPGDFYRGMLDEFLDLADEIAAESSAADRRELVRRAGHAVRYEWAFVDAAWRLESWPF